ncbi:hypothetical protein BJX62DRAFT_220191 [Aspergillus germanicus]
MFPLPNLLGSSEGLTIVVGARAIKEFANFQPGIPGKRLYCGRCFDVRFIAFKSGKRFLAAKRGERASSRHPCILRCSHSLLHGLESFSHVPGSSVHHGQNRGTRFLALFFSLDMCSSRMPLEVTPAPVGMWSVAGIRAADKVNLTGSRPSPLAIPLQSQDPSRVCLD